MSRMINASAKEFDWAKTPEDAKVLVVGAGGIGCELLKNLVMTGFHHIQVIDLDTIDVSNLNRQFLFHREHVGKSKANVAVEKMRDLLCRTGRAKLVDGINAYHGSIFDSQFDVTYFGAFDIVLSALDNKAARSHVNRLCIAADVVLVESGTAGYLGQVTVIKKGMSECYDCYQKPAQRTYPGCTIRNTPSEPIHCIVWAKHLFNQLFGAPEIDEDVAPDMADPELVNGDAHKQSNGVDGDDSATDPVDVLPAKQGVRQWAESIDFEADMVFDKLFHADIASLLTMDTLWTKRQAPKPLKYDDTKVDGNDAHASGSSVGGGLSEQRVWSIHECAETFAYCLLNLKRSLHAMAEKEGGKGVLSWDKDDDVAMDFVTCVANLRAHIFNIGLKSRFDIKSMAGNIIPAIATTNAIVAAGIVMETMKILRHGDASKCSAVFFSKQPNTRGKTLVDQELPPPNNKCIVCAKARVYVRLNTHTFTVRQLGELLLKKHFSMQAPDVVISQSATIIISSDEGECENLLDKSLAEVGVASHSELAADDYLQSLEFRIVIIHSDKIGSDRTDTELFTVHDRPPPVEGEKEEEEKPSTLVEETMTTESPVSRKRALQEDNKAVGVDEDGLDVKKVKSNSVVDL